MSSVPRKSLSAKARLELQLAASPTRSLVVLDDRPVAEVLAAYGEYAKRYSVGADGEPTKELVVIDYALKPVLDLYAALPVVEFGPRALAAVRQAMIAAKLSRPHQPSHRRREARDQVGRERGTRPAVRVRGAPNALRAAPRAHGSQGDGAGAAGAGRGGRCHPAPPATPRSRNGGADAPHRDASSGGVQHDPPPADINRSPTLLLSSLLAAHRSGDLLLERFCARRLTTRHHRNGTPPRHTSNLNRALTDAVRVIQPPALAPVPNKHLESLEKKFQLVRTFIYHAPPDFFALYLDCRAN